MISKALTSILVASAGLTIAIATASRASEREEAAEPPGAAAPKGTLKSLEWLAGVWRSEGEGIISEERWAPPLGGCMIGSFRRVEGGRPVFYEILVIEDSPEGPTLRLKHFSANLRGWEEAEAPPGYVLVESSPDLAVFAQETAPGAPPARQTYRRLPSGALKITVETSRKGEAATLEFVLEPGG